MSNNYFEFKQFKIFQDKTAMKVNTDGVLLGAWVDIGSCNNALDIGTGTGAWASLFFENGATEVKGVDFSEKMLKQAKQAHCDIEFLYGDAKNLLNIADNSFDVVTASLVLHGTKREVRKLILTEMKRISKQYVIIHDFVGKTPFGIKILEWLEKSDFVNFKKTFEEEMKEFFNENSILEVGGGIGLYIGKVHST